MRKQFPFSGPCTRGLPRVFLRKDLREASELLSLLDGSHSIPDSSFAFLTVCRRMCAEASRLR